MRETPEFISLYSGCGGLDLGFIRAGFKPVWANDFDSDAVATYKRNIGTHIEEGDVDHLVDLDRLRGHPGAIVIGGPPCQGFSVAGQMRTDDPRSRHVWRFLELVGELSPPAFVMENVAAIAVNRRWSKLHTKLQETARHLGFRTRTWILNASHFGVAQGRVRMFMVGIRDSDPVEPTVTSQEDPPTVREVLNQLPRCGSPGNDGLCTAIVTPARRPVLRRSPFAGMLFNGKGRALNLDAPASTLPASMGGNRTPIVDQMQLEEKVGRCWVEGYHARLMRGDPPVTRIPKRMRRLTVQESAAIQGFPSDWEFHGRRNSQFRQIGNAVPPPLGYAVALSVRRRLTTAEMPVSADESLLLAA